MLKSYHMKLTDEEYELLLFSLAVAKMQSDKLGELIPSEKVKAEKIKGLIYKLNYSRLGA